MLCGGTGQIKKLVKEMREKKENGEMKELIIHYYCPNNNCKWTADVPHIPYVGQSVYWYTCPQCNHTLKKTKTIVDKQDSEGDNSNE